MRVIFESIYGRFFHDTSEIVFQRSPSISPSSITTRKSRVRKSAIQSISCRPGQPPSKTRPRPRHVTRRHVTTRASRRRRENRRPDRRRLANHDAAGAGAAVLLVEKEHPVNDVTIACNRAVMTSSPSFDRSRGLSVHAR